MKLGHWFYNDALAASSHGGIGAGWAELLVCGEFFGGGPAVLWSGGEAGLQTCAVGGSRTCITWRASRSQLYRSTLSQASLVSTHRPATANQSSPGRCHCLVCINLHVFAYKYTRLADPLGTHPEWHFLASSMSISRFCSSYPFTSTDKSKKIIY